MDWFVLQSQLQDQTFLSVLRTADISRGEKLVQFITSDKDGKSGWLRDVSALMSNSQFASLSLASAKVTPGLKASEYSKESRRFVRTRVVTSRLQDDVAASTN